MYNKNYWVTLLLCTTLTFHDFLMLKFNLWLCLYTILMRERTQLWHNWLGWDMFEHPQNLTAQVRNRFLLQFLGVNGLGWRPSWSGPLGIWTVEIWLYNIIIISYETGTIHTACMSCYPTIKSKGKKSVMSVCLLAHKSCHSQVEI